MVGINLSFMHRTRVIIIEDEFFAASHLEETVESLGFEVVAIYYSGEEFLTQTEWAFDVALVDVSLSDDLNGIDVAREMRKEGKGFVFITASQDEKTMMAAMSLEPIAYINKPFQMREVANALNGVRL